MAAGSESGGLYAMVEGTVAILSWLLSWFKPRKASNAFEGFNLLTGDQRLCNHQVLEELNKQRGRLDKCDSDRAELRTKCDALDGRVKVCEDDRADLRDRLNKHSIEFKSALGISDNPQLPHRTTRKHFPDRDQQDAENE